MLVNMHEAKTHLSRLVERVQTGDEVVIGNNGRPVARLVPYVDTPAPRVPGRLKGKIRIADDFDRTPEWLIESFGSSE